jgi:hypothetical protein
MDRGGSSAGQGASGGVDGGSARGSLLNRRGWSGATFTESRAVANSNFELLFRNDGAVAAPGGGTMRQPTNVRYLAAGEIGIAKDVYKESIPYDSTLIFGRTWRR